ncbi:MAG: bifunctional demethylmenaquinone methyltransferase/2-methoxy-6-polyprenyl-1,4-benzoquinol methylase UbiE [Flavobacteriales bacterium]|nr:bifunctional demethylmenaquinone methyltransferase/2-methoxy-6-polyprenyl-1,4-benzoquinol methylase UbiE [Flavobacteriales bacterium]
MSKVTPYNSSKSKKKQVSEMFDNIANSYDFLNHSLSLGMDNVWRKIAIKKLTNNPKTILDIATGTGDFAVSAAKYTDAKITGIDISQGMLNVGIEKIRKKNLNNRISLQLADSESLPFNDNTFDAITAGFGVRNFENLNKGLSEMKRVLNKNGIVVILEPSTPKYFPLKQLYTLYFHHVLPTIGAWISKDKSAYSYLPESVDAFPSGEKFIVELKNVGFRDCKHIPLTFGIVSLYIAIK